jgi:hypothetical protein
MITIQFLWFDSVSNFSLSFYSVLPDFLNSESVPAPRTTPGSTVHIVQAEMHHYIWKVLKKAPVPVAISSELVLDLRRLQPGRTSSTSGPTSRVTIMMAATSDELWLKILKISESSGVIEHHSNQTPLLANSGPFVKYFGDYFWIRKKIHSLW